ncbi:MAG: hypothetical protein NTU85_03035 [Candidatus Kaiserbacteria bacterium]|nr:hypothetical protein [Candidatus Kaiserbacteria bacterium]
MGDDIIVRRAKANRRKTPQEALNATYRLQYIDCDVVDAMPRGDGEEETEVFFFKLGRRISNDDLEKKYELRGFKPVDPFLLAAVNEDSQSFAHKFPNCTIWKDTSGKWCYLAFNRRSEGRSLGVGRCDGWGDLWWFAGVKK